MKIFDPSIHLSLSKQNIHIDEFVFLDIEASGLDFDSFPIEVAFASSNGDKATYLIKPTYDWQEDGQWDTGAELTIHHISLDDLLTHGDSAKDVALALNSALPDAERFVAAYMAIAHEG